MTPASLGGAGGQRLRPAVGAGVDHLGVHRAHHVAKVRQSRRQRVLQGVAGVVAGHIGLDWCLRRGGGAQLAQNAVARAHALPPVRSSRKLARCLPRKALPSWASLPLIFNKQPPSAVTNSTAPLSCSAALLSLTIAPEISGWRSENTPPKPQHSDSWSCTTRSTWASWSTS